MLCIYPLTCDSPARFPFHPTVSLSQSPRLYPAISGYRVHLPTVYDTKRCIPLIYSSFKLSYLDNEQGGRYRLITLVHFPRDEAPHLPDPPVALGIILISLSDCITLAEFHTPERQAFLYPSLLPRRDFNATWQLPPIKRNAHK